MLCNYCSIEFSLCSQSSILCSGVHSKATKPQNSSVKKKNQKRAKEQVFCFRYWLVICMQDNSIQKIVSILIYFMLRKRTSHLSVSCRSPSDLLKLDYRITFLSIELDFNICQIKVNINSSKTKGFQ